MLEWADDLKISDSDLFLDSRQSRTRCFVSHAHADHLAIHQSAISTVATSELALHRIGTASTTELEFGIPHRLDPNLEITLHSAGHILGSAMLHARFSSGTLLYTGDFKLRRSLTVPVAAPVPAGVLVMESTYGKPYFRFPPATLVAEELIEKVTDALAEGRQPIVMGYSLGKAQEIVRILTDAHLPVTCHGAVHSLNAIYEEQNVALGNTRKYRSEDFHGAHALDLQERGVLVAPPNVARSAFANRFEKSCKIIMTGWALTSGAKYRYGVDHALPLSDHADFDELLELIERVAPKTIYTHHGFPEFAETLRARGLDAVTARPDKQLMLFND